MPNAGATGRCGTLQHTTPAAPLKFSRTVRARPERLEIVAAYGGWAGLPGSGCALSPCAHAFLLNSLLPFQLPFFIRVGIIRFSAKWHPRWRARVVGRSLCCCDYRVVNRCFAHPPRAGGQKTKLDPRGSGLGLAGRLVRPGEGRGVNMLLAQKSRASGSKSAQAARLLCFAQKVLARFTDLQALCGEGRCL